MRRLIWPIILVASCAALGCATGSHKLDRARDAGSLHILIDQGIGRVASVLLRWVVEGGRDPRIHEAHPATLAKTLETDKTADVFMTSDEVLIDELIKRGLLDATSKTHFATLYLVVVVPHAATWVPKDLTGLAAPQVRALALADAGSPEGDAAEAALRQAGVWEILKERVHRAGYGNWPMGLFVGGKLQAAIAFRGELADQAQVAFEVPTESYSPIRCWAAVAARTQRKADAERFVQFLKSPEAARVLEGVGIEPVLRTSEDNSAH
ncbi:MAG TPA: molybdate ABC transporter substrate-binding protein [bacterium]|nr:molybdate ABC transporter substrate-binding protein [bacterium]